MSVEFADRTTHKVQVSAPAGVVYALIADAVNWPLHFAPSIHVERLEFDGERERLRTWCVMDGRLKSWTSWRYLDPVKRCVEFRQELPAPPLSALGGIMSVRPQGPHSSEIELLYGFSVTGDLPDDVAWVERAVDVHSRLQLAGLKAVAERWTRLDELVLSFEESVHVNGPAELVYDFLYRAGDWPQTVPHVTRADLTEDVPGVQRMTMETLTEYGTHTTNSVRICFPHAERIIYKETATPTLLESHTGEWSVVPDERGVTVTAQHTVVLREESIAAELGEHASLAHARRHVREALGRNCRVLLALAKQHAESAVRML
ncbi:aromatase/cyclase [Streptomyces sp. NPDC093544]|jgi:aromatase|uniref:aromatase/cyclase n=1 Tax=Streptomyces sp. NPDC093544 TaxID=3155200 RepID=UPI00342F371C